ncbi:MAG: DUF2306 domain-containing protein [Allosphingosinicella sp.]
MDRRLAPILSKTWSVAIVLLTLEIAIVSSLRYLAENGGAPPPILANAYASPFLIAHVVGGVIALLLGPLQFVRRLRTRRPALHRATGLAYVAACAIAAPAGFMLALGTTAGPVAATGFAIPALLLPVFTALGLAAALDRRFHDHRAWMLRSYALIATAITLRLMLPASALLGFDFLPAYRAIAWLAWMTNLALAEFHIRRTRAATAGYGTLATA